ncbi:MAG: hypothetical protein AAB403_23065, partial [Planctomycetota bacterium]
RETLLEWMRKTGDPALEAFENRTSPQALSKFMAEQDAGAGRKVPKPKQQKKQKVRKAKGEE